MWNHSELSYCDYEVWVRETQLWNCLSWENVSFNFQNEHFFNAFNFLSNLFPVKNVTRIFSCLFDGSLVENETKSDGNPITFLANATKIPWLELFQNPSHIPACKTNKAWTSDMEQSWNLVSISTKLLSIFGMKWHVVFMKIRVTFFTEDTFNFMS